LANAFDWVNHEILLIGIQGATASCFKSYLKEIKKE
jgi:hypothetical protein